MYWQAVRGAIELARIREGASSWEDSAANELLADRIREKETVMFRRGLLALSGLGETKLKLSRPGLGGDEEFLWSRYILITYQPSRCTSPPFLSYSASPF